MAEAVKLLVGGPQPLYVVAFGALCIAMQVFFSYERTVRVLKWLTLALFAYVAVVLVVRVPWRAGAGRIGAALGVPAAGTTAKDYAAMVVAVLGTTISPYLFFWQATQEVEDCRRRPEGERLRHHPRLRAQAPAAHQARHGGRHGLLEPGRLVHRRRHRGDAEPARHRQHPDLGPGGRGAAPGGGRIRVPGVRARHHRHRAARGAGARRLGGVRGERAVRLEAPASRAASTRRAAST